MHDAVCPLQFAATVAARVQLARKLEAKEPLSVRTTKLDM
jgi:hypothetical protein